MPDIAAPASLYQAPAVQFNPLQQLTQLQALKNSQLQNRIAQQGFDATQAQQQAYQGSQNPDGSTDVNKLTSLMNSGAGAQNSGAVQQQSLTNQNSAQTLSKAQFDQYSTQLSHVEGIAGTLANKPGVTMDDVTSVVESSIKNGNIPLKVGIQLLSTAPKDPAQIQQWLKNGAANAAGAQAQLTNMNPSYAQVDNGPSVLGVNTNPGAIGGGVGTVGYSVQKALSPETASAPVSVVNPSGTPGITPRGSLWGGQSGAVGDGRYPQAQGAQGAQGAQPGAAPFVPTAMAPGADPMAKDAATRVGALQQAAGTAKTQMHSYDLALDAVNKAIVGRGSSVPMNMQEVMQTMGVGNQWTSDNVKNTQLLTAQLQSAGDQAASAMGLTGTNAKMASVFAAQPNASMNKPALIEQIKYVKGLQQGVLDKQSAVQNYLSQNGNNTANLGQFEAQYNQAFNPDVSYVRSLSSQADKQAAIRALPDHGAYVKSVQAMKQMGAF